MVCFCIYLKIKMLSPLSAYQASLPLSSLLCHSFQVSHRNTVLITVMNYVTRKYFYIQTWGHGICLLFKNHATLIPAGFLPARYFSEQNQTWWEHSQHPAKISESHPAGTNRQVSDRRVMRLCMAQPSR